MNWYYTKQGYALRQDDSATDDHWFGGKPYHKGATCPMCKIPLLLVADLSCASFRAKEDARLFHELERIPLYYCWRCSAQDLSYQVVKPNKINILGHKGSPQADDFPYKDFPEQFPRKPVSAVPIPYETAKLLVIVQEVDDNCLGNGWLSQSDLELLAKKMRLLRHDRFDDREINLHQIGGLFKGVQGHERVACPNEKCDEHKQSKKNYNFRMKELALICNDPYSGLPMIERIEDLERGRFNDSVQLIYWICEECLTITVSNRCD